MLIGTGSKIKMVMKALPQENIWDIPHQAQNLVGINCIITDMSVWTKVAEICLTRT